MGEEIYQQLSLWDYVYPKKVIDKPIRLIEFFAGIGAQHKALKQLTDKVKSWKICEWAYNSYCSYNAIHIKDFKDYSQGLSKEELIKKVRGTSTNYNEPLTDKQLKAKPIEWLRNAYNNIVATHNLINIMEVHGKDLQIEDTDKYEYIMTYSFPCFTADTLVLTQNGNKYICDLTTDDCVLTHDKTYRRVEKVVNNGQKEIIKLKASCFDELLTTNNHRFYVKENNNEIKWKEVKDLTTKDYIGIAINQENVIPNYSGIDYYWKDGRKARHKQTLDLSNKDFWWLVGRYIGDGWFRTQGGIIICCAKNELKEITDKIDNLINYNVVEEKDTYKIHIPSKELSNYLFQFGKGAKNKHLTKDIIDLPIDLLSSFLNGYISADGCVFKNRIQCNSVSKQLIYDLAQCFAKVYKKPYSIYKVNVKPKKIIEGRIVNQNNWYQLIVRLNPRQAYYENGYIWYPLKNKTTIDHQEVYDIQVSQNHSFMANGVIVHNCQDLSLAGKRQGMSVSQAEGGTRSGLLWEVERILTELVEGGYSLPQILVMENVPQVICDDFKRWQYKLESLGYKNYVKILNAKDYGIPQNRRRCFMVSILGEYAYTFPVRLKREYKLKDILEKIVDKKYYLTNEHIERISNWKAQQKPLENMKSNVLISPTITARGAGEDHSGMVLIDTELFKDGEVIDYDSSDEFRREHSTEESPSLVAHSKLAIVEKNDGGGNTNNGSD